MSHYIVAVFHREDQKVEDLLAPFDENTEVEPYIRYTRQEAIDFVREHWGDWAKDKSDDECWNEIADEYDNNTDENGNIYSTYNPDSKWDWWSYGGRFGGSIKLKGKDEYTDEARVGDADFSDDKETYEQSLKFWDDCVDGKAPSGDLFFYKPEYYKEFYGDRETYARFQARFSTFAVVTPDGEWHEKGTMGWFGCSSETPEEARSWEEHYKERFIDTADPDWIISIVDCHI